MEEITMKNIEDLGGKLRYNTAEDGALEPVVEFYDTEDKENEEPFVIHPLSENRFEPTLNQLCEAVDSVKGSATDIIFVLYQIFECRRNFSLIFELLGRGVPFQNAFAIIEAVSFIEYIADCDDASDQMLDNMLIITEELATEVSSVLLSFSENSRQQTSRESERNQ